MAIYFGSTITSNLLGSGFQNVDNYQTMTAIASPANGITVFVHGRLFPNDGGEGVWRWSQGSTATADGATILSSTSGAIGRWMRVYDDGMFNARWFADADAIIAFSAENSGTMFFPSGVYDFIGKTIPAGITYIGPGWRFYNADAYFGVGGPGSAVILGPVRQGQTRAGGGFKRMVFAGGLSIEAPHTEIHRCAFTGIAGTLKFDASLPSVPSWCTIRGCLFSCISTAPSILLKGDAKGNMFAGNTIIVNHAERGIVAELSTLAPSRNSFNDINFYDGCNATTVGAYLYGDFQRSSFRCNTATAAGITFADTTPFVFSANSSNNKIQITNAETYTDAGTTNTFTT